MGDWRPPFRSPGGDQPPLPELELKLSEGELKDLLTRYYGASISTHEVTGVRLMANKTYGYGDVPSGHEITASILMKPKAKTMT